MRSKTKTIQHRVQVKRSVAKTKVTGKHTLHRSVAWHKKIALHPINILFLLCVGVMLTGATINALADSYSVNAVVPAQPLTQPAFILQPTDGVQLSTQVVTVSGSCPANSYVNVSDNGHYAGTDLCLVGTFRVTVELGTGANQLSAQDYNLTDVPGPSAATVTAYYVPSSSDSPTPSEPSAITVPTTVQVMQVDNGAPYDSTGAAPTVSDLPTFSGVAPPFSRIVIEVHSNPVFCKTQANAQGYWACTLQQPLPNGAHQVYVTATEPSGLVIHFPRFAIQVAAGSPAKTILPVSLLDLTANYKYSIYNIGQPVPINLTTSGGVAPYALSVDWGDGKLTTTFKKSGGTFGISHTYGWFSAMRGTKTIKIAVIDAAGASRSLQLVAALRNPAFHNIVLGIAGSTGVRGVLDGIRSWLWLLWPGYAIAILLVFSFWLGERQELLAIMGKHRPKHSASKR